MFSVNDKQLPIKVIQFGEGNFLRAFVDWMIQKMNDQGIFNGQIAVVQPLPNGLAPLLNSQNCQYTHFLKGMKDGTPYEFHYLNKSIQKIINPYDDFDAFLDLANNLETQIIISNTTEAGIEFKSSDLFSDNANVAFPAKLTRLLLRRYEITNGDLQQGFIIMPCELIDKNADILKSAVLSTIDSWQLSEEFKHWVIEANTFCNTLVDRIVPGYPKDTIQQVWQTIGYEDKLVVESELFDLWVVEGNDRVRKAFPAMDAGCNLLVVDDATPFKTRKVRILNGAHTSLVPIAYLYGKETVRESLEDPILEKFLNQALFDEIIPTLTLSKEMLETYANEVIQRFKNPYIKHYLISIALNSLSKYKTRVLPSLTGYLDIYKCLPKRLVASLAAMIVFYRGHYGDKVIPINDTPDVLALFETAWSGYNGTYESIEMIVTTVLGYELVWQGNLNHLPGLKELVASYIQTILDSGMETLLAELEEVL